MSSREIHDIIARLKAEGVIETVRGLGEVSNEANKGKTAFKGFEQAGAIAAGMLLRDMVRGTTAAFGESLKLGASIETLEAAFNALTIEVSDEIISLESLREATLGTVSNVDLLRAANNALALGLPTEDLNDLFAAAQTVGAAMGRTTLEAVNDLTTGIGRQSRLILDNLGILVNAETAYKEYAATLGVTASSLTDAQRKTAFMTAAIEALNSKAETLAGTTSKAQIAQEGFSASIKNLKTGVGELLAPLGAVGPVLHGIMPIFATYSSVLIPKLIAEYGALGLATNAWAAITSLASRLVTTSLLGIPIIGWIAAATLAIVGLKTAWDNNWFGIRDTVKNVVNSIGGIFNKLKNLLSSLGKAWSNFWNSAQKDASMGSEAIMTYTEAMEYGESPGGIRDVIAAVEDLDRIWSQVIPNLEEPQTMFDEPRIPGLGGAREEGTPSMEEGLPQMMRADDEGPGLRRERMNERGDINVTFVVRGEFTRETYERIRPELQKDLRSVLIESTSTGSSTDKVILRRG